MPMLIFWAWDTCASPASISAQQDSTSGMSPLMSGLGTALRLLATYKAVPPAFVGESAWKKITAFDIYDRNRLLT